MCFWPVAHVELEEYPPKKKEKEKEKEKETIKYRLVSDRLNLQSIVGVDLLQTSLLPFILPHIQHNSFNLKLLYLRTSPQLYRLYFCVPKYRLELLYG